MRPPDSPLAERPLHCLKGKLERELNLPGGPGTENSSAIGSEGEAVGQVKVDEIQNIEAA